MTELQISSLAEVHLRPAQPTPAATAFAPFLQQYSAAAPGQAGLTLADSPLDAVAALLLAQGSFVATAEQRGAGKVLQMMASGSYALAQLQLTPVRNSAVPPQEIMTPLPPEQTHNISRPFGGADTAKPMALPLPTSAICDSQTNVIAGRWRQSASQAVAGSAGREQWRQPLPLQQLTIRRQQDGVHVIIRDYFSPPSPGNHPFAGWQSQAVTTLTINGNRMSGVWDGNSSNWRTG
jgi:hypothetical protein